MVHGRPSCLHQACCSGHWEQLLNRQNKLVRLWNRTAKHAASTTRLSRLLCCVSAQMTLMVDIQACPVCRVSKECNSYEGNAKDRLASNLLNSRHPLNGWFSADLGNESTLIAAEAHCQFSKDQVPAWMTKRAAPREHLLPYYLI